MEHHNAGTNQTLSALSTKYWIIAASEEIADWEKQYVSYVRIKRKAKCVNQILAPLLLNRLKSSLRAFIRTAVTNTYVPFSTTSKSDAEIKVTIKA